MDTQPEVTSSVVVTHEFPHSPETIYDSFLDPSIASKFLFATPTGQMIRAEIDPRIGGVFTFVDRRDGSDTLHAGEYLEMDRPNHLVFTFAVPQYSPVFTRVAIDIDATPNGSSLTLTHDGVLPDYLQQTEAGWKMILLSLARTLSAYDL